MLSRRNCYLVLYVSVVFYIQGGDLCKRNLIIIANISIGTSVPLSMFRYLCLQQKTNIQCQIIVLKRRIYSQISLRMIDHNYVRIINFLSIKRLWFFQRYYQTFNVGFEKVQLFLNIHRVPRNYCHQICQHIWYLTTVQYILSIWKLQPRSNVSFIFYIWISFLLKRDTILISRIYVSVFFPLLMLIYLCL